MTDQATLKHKVLPLPDSDQNEKHLLNRRRKLFGRGVQIEILIQGQRQRFFFFFLHRQLTAGFKGMADL